MTSEEIDKLRNFGDVPSSLVRFKEAVESHPASEKELKTQMARCYGLMRQFSEGWNQIYEIGEPISTKVQVRIWLESGRLTNSSGDKAGSVQFFDQALNLAVKEGFDYYAVDAAHMLGIVLPGDQALDWNQRAIDMARKSKDSRAQGWQGSLNNNLAWTYHDMGKFGEALVCFENALAYFRSTEKVAQTRIAEWSVARCYRSLGRFDEALAIQLRLEKGEPTGYVFEELGELYLVLGKEDASKLNFKRAYEILSEDVWLMENEKERMERMKRLGGD